MLRSILEVAVLKGAARSVADQRVKAQSAHQNAPNRLVCHYFLMQRYGMIIRLRPEAEAAYRQHHLAVWPAVLNTITACNIRNYTIFLRDGCLFGYFEYIGQDYAADMRKMAADPATQQWWAIMEPMQEPLANRAEGEWWALMEEVFHHE